LVDPLEQAATASKPTTIDERFPPRSIRCTSLGDP
jgi:hypothetical protein